jgi:lipopolysaccharide export system permease protein
VRHLDRYMLRRFGSSLALSIGALLLLSVVVDLIERMDVFIDHHAAPRQILLYYLYRLPYWFVLTLPVAALLGTLFSLTGLAYRNEIMAMKAAGISLYRILMPIFAFMLLFSGLVFVFTDRVVPEANHAFGAIDQQIRSRSPDRGPRRRVLLQDRKGQLVFARRYDAARQQASEVQWEKLVESRVQRRITARLLEWREDHWVFVDGHIYSFDPGRTDASRFDTLTATGLSLLPQDFAGQDRLPDEMDYRTLNRYIERTRANGEDATRSLVDLYLKVSFPFTCFVIVFLGAPIAADARHAGLAASFGRGLLICFAFYGCVQAGQALGWNKILPPLLGAWLANLLFGPLALVLLWRAHK